MFSFLFTNRVLVDDCQLHPKQLGGKGGHVSDYIFPLLHFVSVLLLFLTKLLR